MKLTDKQLREFLETAGKAINTPDFIQKSFILRSCDIAPAAVEELLAAREQLQKFREVLKFYATYSPRYHPDGFWEIHIAEGEGGEVRFGNRARRCLAEYDEKWGEK